MHNMPHTMEARKKMSESRKGVPLPHKRRPSVVEDGVTKWKCCDCHKFFPAEGFYKNKRTILGITSECRNCHTKTSMRTRDRSKCRETNRVYMHRARARNLDAFRKRERSRDRPKDEKYLARKAVNLAVRSGRLIRPECCEVCGKTAKVQGHHEDYQKQLEVKWLCVKCHGKAHWKVEFKKV